jgi:GNAT superfamily N-acetyltransferase
VVEEDGVAVGVAEPGPMADAGVPHLVDLHAGCLQLRFRLGDVGDAQSNRSRRQRQYGVRMADAATTPQVTIVPANEASCEDLQAVFGARGGPSRCQCQRFKAGGRQWDSEQASVPVEQRAARLREQTRCGHPEARSTSGLVAYLDGERVGRCAVEPRTAYVRLGRVPWAGRSEDKTDDSVWALTCFVTRTGFRRRGVSRALARAAVDFARQRGARALEGYR